MGLPRKDASDRCYATEFLLRSGRGAAVAADDAMEPLGPVLRRPPEDHEFYLGRIEVGLRQVGRRLDNLMAALAPYRSEKLVEEVDCSKQLFRRLKAYRHSDNNLEGSAQALDFTEAAWTAPEPDTFDATIVRDACL